MATAWRVEETTESTLKRREYLTSRGLLFFKKYYFILTAPLNISQISVLSPFLQDKVSSGLGWPQTCYVAEDDLKFLTLWPLSPECAQCLISAVLGLKPGAPSRLDMHSSNRVTPRGFKRIGTEIMKSMSQMEKWK